MTTVVEGVAVNPHARADEAEGFLNAPLIPTFRYVHEPLRAGDAAIPFVGAANLVEALRERILHSRGGAFLVTGFRGVGKTTVVRRALTEIADLEIEGARILPVTLNVARPMSTDEVLFEVIRRLFERLIDEDFLDTLEPRIAQALLVAYTRTSMAVKEMNAASREQTTNVGLGSAKTILDSVVPGAGGSHPLSLGAGTSRRPWRPRRASLPTRKRTLSTIFSALSTC